MKFNYSKVILLGIGYFGISVSWAAYNIFVPVLLANKFQLGPVSIGGFMALDNIAALLIQPPVGMWSDRLRTPLGRRMPFILVGAPIAAGVLGFIPMAAALPVFIACAVTFLLTMAFWRSPFFTLLPDTTPSPYRSQANGIINAIGVLGAVIAFLGGAQLYGLNPAYPFWMGSSLLVAAVVLLLVFFREPQPEQRATERPPGIFEAVREVWQDQDKSVLRVLLAILLVFISNNAVEAFIALYAVHHLGLTPADGARLMGQMTVAFVLCAVPAGFMGSRVGRRWSICVGITVMMLCGLVQYLLPVSSLAHQVGNLPVLGAIPVAGLAMMLTGVGWALIHTNTLPMVVDSTTADRAGTYIGLYYLFSTIGAVIGPIAAGWIIEWNGTDYSRTMLAAPLFLLLALIVMVGVRRGEAIQPLAARPKAPLSSI